MDHETIYYKICEKHGLEVGSQIKAGSTSYWVAYQGSDRFIVRIYEEGYETFRTYAYGDLKTL